MNKYICVIDQACPVNMAGYWPKNELGQYPFILIEQAQSIEDLLYGQKITQKNFAFAGTKREIPSGPDRPILLSRVANQNTGFALSCPLADTAI